MLWTNRIGVLLSVRPADADVGKWSSPSLLGPYSIHVSERPSKTGCGGFLSCPLFFRIPFGADWLKPRCCRRRLTPSSLPFTDVSNSVIRSSTSPVRSAMGQSVSLSSLLTSCPSPTALIGHPLAGRSTFIVRSRQAISRRFPRTVSASAFNLGCVMSRPLQTSAAYRTQWQRDLVVSVGPDIAANIRWARSPIPFIHNIEVLLDWPHVPGDLRARTVLFSDLSRPTRLEAASGHGLEKIHDLPLAPYHSLADLTADFDRFAAPSRVQCLSRAKYWRYWKLCVSWAARWRRLDALVPMSLDTLKALSWHLMLSGYSAASVRDVWSAIQHRHDWFDLPKPIQGKRQFSLWSNCVLAASGAPRALKLPISRDIVVALLESRTDRLAVLRDKILTVVATIACLRPSEVCALQVCDALFDFHVHGGWPEFRGSVVLRIIKRKNDSARKGHFPALAKSENTRWDVVAQLREYLARASLAVQPTCSKPDSPHASCLVCPPLFPRCMSTRAGLTTASNRPMSTQMVGDAIQNAVASVGFDPALFSAVSARKGGISAALDAGVPEEIIFLQSGHGHARPARVYMHLQHPDRLYDTFRAFRL